MIDAPLTVIVGTGALGTALAVRLSEVGYPILAIVSRQQITAAPLADRVNARYALALGESIPDETSLVLLCVPDDAIEETAARMAKSNGWRDTVAGHTSGAFTAALLAPLAQQGAATMSFHPIQTFSKNAASTFEGVYFGLEGDSEAIRLGYKVARDLGGLPLTIASEAKTRYHLAASMASNLFVGLAGMACDVLASTGVDPAETMRILYPLIYQTSRNMAEKGPAPALTGPAARGDLRTIQDHLEALATYFPHYRPAYLALVEHTIEQANEAGRLSKEKARKLTQALQASARHSD